VNAVHDLVSLLLSLKITVRSADDRVFVESPFSVPIPEDLLAELRARKDEVLAYLKWRDAAEEMVAMCFRRLGMLRPEGFSTNMPQWKQQDAALHDAFWSGDPELLARALDDYEGFIRRVRGPEECKPPESAIVNSRVETSARCLNGCEVV
jgi:hypothetical protein